MTPIEGEYWAGAEQPLMIAAPTADNESTVGYSSSVVHQCGGPPEEMLYL